MSNQLSSIKHIVHVMLENRSFDQMLGFLYTDDGNKSPVTGDAYEGLTGKESNPDDAGHSRRDETCCGRKTHRYFCPLAAAPPARSYRVFSCRPTDG